MNGVGARRAGPVCDPKFFPTSLPEKTRPNRILTGPRNGKSVDMKCRYCFRRLRVIPHTPAEIEPHCTAPGCLWCKECAAGQTPVSPGWQGYPQRLTGRDGTPGIAA